MQAQNETGALAPESLAAVEQQRLEALRHRLHMLLAKRLPNTLNISVEGAVGNDLLAMGITPGVALGALRLSLGRYTTTEEIDYAAARIIAAAPQ